MAVPKSPDLEPFVAGNKSRHPLDSRLPSAPFSVSTSINGSNASSHDPKARHTIDDKLQQRLHGHSTFEPHQPRFKPNIRNPIPVEECQARQQKENSSNTDAISAIRSNANRIPLHAVLTRNPHTPRLKLSL
ncbi:hypothetical protein ACLOJK_038569 [Asimina triloba]